jgi:hypothetical protein
MHAKLEGEILKIERAAVSILAKWVSIMWSITLICMIMSHDISLQIEKPKRNKNI